MERTVIEQIVAQVVTVLSTHRLSNNAVKGISVGVSNRHIHLSGEHMELLFGRDYALTPQKELKQVGEYAAVETVTLVGPKGVLRGVRVLGPVREITQIEISRTDGFHLGIKPPLRNSGDSKGSAGIVVVGSYGAITLQEGVICAARHIHMDHEDARHFGVSDKDLVVVEFGGLRGGSFNNVLVRVHASFRLEFHIDTDEANAVDLKNGDQVTLLRRQEG